MCFVGGACGAERSAHTATQRAHPRSPSSAWSSSRTRLRTPPAALEPAGLLALPLSWRLRGAPSSGGGWVLESQRRHSHCPLPTRILADGCLCTLSGTTWARMSTPGNRIPYGVRENEAILDLSFQPFRAAQSSPSRSLIPTSPTPKRKLPLVAFSSLTREKRGRWRGAPCWYGRAFVQLARPPPPGCLRGARSTQGAL